MILSSCNAIMPVAFEASKKQTGTKIDNLANRIIELRKEGFFPAAISARSLAEYADYPSLEPDDIERMDRFITNPLVTLQEISVESNGEQQIDLIYAMLSEDSTVQDVIEAMYNLDPDMASEYEITLQEYAMELGQENESERTVSSSDIYSIKLHQSHYSGTSERALFSSNLADSTIGWYIGYCAVATAGVVTMIASKWFTPWVAVAGAVVALGGFALMSGQMLEWYTNNSDIKEFIAILQVGYDAYRVLKTVTNKDAAMSQINAFIVQKQNNGELYSQTSCEILKELAKEFYGPSVDLFNYVVKLVKKYDSSVHLPEKLGTICFFTAIPAALAFFSSKNDVKNSWNGIVSIVEEALPGVNLTLVFNDLSIKFKRI
jgi:hypothetical protein